MRRRRLLELFCGGGGSAMGYVRAGFDVAGVDILPMPRFPLLDIIQGDALAVLADEEFVRSFDVIHAGPPCKAYTPLWHLAKYPHPRLIAAVRARLIELDVPYVIENVEGARDDMEDPITLCGSMFGLGVDGAVLRRHRLFESNMPIRPPGKHRCGGGVRIVGVYGTGGGWTRTAPGGGGTKVSGALAAQALGVDWTDAQDVLSQMVPPAYTEWIGQQLLNWLGVAA